MAQTLKFAYIVILFVSIFIIVAVGDRKLILILFFVYFIHNFSSILIIFPYSYRTLQRIVKIKTIAMQNTYLLFLETWRAWMVDV
jgi:hypothetical protein